MRYLSVCSGIEAASVAWHHLGWTPVAFSEIEPFPSAVLAHRFPTVPNFGDMTKHEQWPIERGSVDLLVGGTPCQSFSVAGLRQGLADPRGNLMLTYLAIAARLRPRWLVWENVPGVLSSNGGRDFGTFLRALGELGYGWAYRVLDAQWVRTQRHPRAVPQRRRRVFVVGCLGDATRAAQVLFERESVQRDSSPRGKARESVAADAEAGAGAGCYWDGADVANTLTRKGCDDRMPDKDRLFAVLQPVGYRWQNDRDGLVEDGTAPSCRASAGSSGFHEMNHPVVVQPFTKSKRAQPTTDDETWVDGKVNPTLSLFDQGDTRATTVAVAFTPGNLSRGAWPSPNAEVAPTQRCSAGRGADDQRTCVAMVVTDLYNGAITGDVAATMGTPGSSVNASGQTVMAFDWQSGGYSRGLDPKDTAQLQRCQTPAVVHIVNGNSTPETALELAFPLRANDGSGNRQAVAFTPGNLARGAGPSPNAEVAPTRRCSAGRGADDQRTCVAFSSNMSEPDFQTDGTTPTVKVGSGLGIPAPPAVAHALAVRTAQTSANGHGIAEGVSHTLDQAQGQAIAQMMTVRRLTPRECERLQGFPDDWTLIPWRGKAADQCPDGPRYKALGNSMACNCMAWIGERINSINTKETP